MSDPLAQFRRLIDTAFNTGDLSHLDDLLSPAMAEHQFARADGPAPVVGPGGVVAIVSELRRGAPDFHLAVEDCTVAGDTVWVRMRATGTDTGGMLGHAPTQRQFAITVIDVARYDGDLLVEHWGVPDRFGLLEQLGHLPVPQPA